MDSIFQRTAHLNSRHELRLLLLAGAEACWFYALVLAVGTLAGYPHEVSPFGIMLVYWLALVGGRILARQPRSWRVLQWLTVLLAALAVLVGMRVGFYADVPPGDASWLGNYVSNLLAMFQHNSGQLMSTIILVLAFLRGLSFAQRPLTLWVVGFQFRLGIVIFLAACIFAAATSRVEFVVWIFVFFALSLLGISLARIEEAGQERPLGARWVLVLGASVAGTMLLGLIAAQFLTLAALGAFFGLFAPVGWVFQLIFTILAIPLFYLIKWLVDVLSPLLHMVFTALADLLPNFHIPPLDTTGAVSEVARQIQNFAPVLRVAGVVVVGVFVAWLVARALNKRIRWYEDEQFVLESLPERNGLARENVRAVKPPRVQYEIHAENVRRMYAALCARASALGLERRAAETPFEFLPRLHARFPEAAAGISRLTDAYCAVHYAQRPATEEQVRELRQVWDTVKQAMGDLGKSV